MQQAFILRIAPSNVNKVPLALKSDQVIIGWSATAGLLDLTLSWKAFRKKLHDTHYAPEKISAVLVVLPDICGGLSET
ncbi:hypothetical protein RHM58_25285 [Pseudomonas sp. 10S4]|uniref:hypothetical protein n=1 Tax=Pseudomonas sp. 10S4 TaxID=3048583 RepID=UPI002AC93909|nr:hypothetical protein [Pseudomonas sp. 10S4]WPX17204.1 hypothetical protein RHM58_25285 [Pseudomonas sp. 10S4]